MLCKMGEEEWKGEDAADSFGEGGGKPIRPSKWSSEEEEGGYDGDRCGKRKRVDLNRKDTSGDTALHIAAR